MGAHTDSGWDRRHLELTKRRKVLEESGGRRQSLEEESGVVGRVWRRAEVRRAWRRRAGSSAEPGGGERGSSAESGVALGRLSCGEGSTVTTSISRGEARDVARCPVMPRVSSPGPGEAKGTRRQIGPRRGCVPARRPSLHSIVTASCSH